jgi:hypothetical protein
MYAVTPCRSNVGFDYSGMDCGPPLWSSGQSSWLQIQRSRIRFPAPPDLLRSSGLERRPLNLVSTTEELLGRNGSGSSLGITAVRDPSR